MPDKPPPARRLARGLIVALRHVPLAALVAAMPAAAAVDVPEPGLPSVVPAPGSLQARVAAVRAALALETAAMPAAAASRSPTLATLAQSPNWTNWPKWSKWSNWANK